MKRITFTFILLFLKALAFSQTTTFIEQDWEKAMQLSKEQHKILLVDYYTDWCGWCKEMDRTTFKDSAVSNFIASYFIPLKINAEKGIGLELAVKYRVSVFPSGVFYSSDGKVILKHLGYQNANDYIKTLQKVIEFNRTGKYCEGISGNTKTDFPDFYRESFNKTKRTKPDSVLIAAFLRTQKDLFTESSFSVLWRFKTNDTINQFFLGNIDKYRKLFGEADVNEKALTIIRNTYKSAVAQKDSTLLKNFLAMIDKYMVEDKEELKLHYQLTYYEETEDWNNFSARIDAEFKNGKIDGNNMNGYSWTIYEKASDPAVVRKAVKWMSKVTAASPTYAYLDTYAALLYKDKQYKIAETIALKAIDKGKANKEDVKATEELLEKIKNERKGK